MKISALARPLAALIAAVTIIATAAPSALRATPVSTAPTSVFDITGFATVGTPTTGGGEIAETNAAYRKVTTPLEFVTAIRDANKTAGAVRVIEIMNDLNMGWNEIDAATKALASNPIRAHAPAKLHPVLIASGVSLMDVKAKGGGLTIFSANGATIKHVTLNIKDTSNIIIRNLKFDEMWEWDEATKGDYDSNDWDFITLGNGDDATNIWIDHCTFTKSYDGITDMKSRAARVTYSWCRITGGDISAPDSFVRKQIDALETSPASYTFYNFLRTNGFTKEDIVTISAGQKKGILMGATDLDTSNNNLNATFHHLLMENLWDRAIPRLRGGNVHVYNVILDDTDALVAKRLRDAVAATMTPANLTKLNGTYKFQPPLNGCISTEGAALLLEKSIYIDCMTPLRNNQSDVNNPAYTGKIFGSDVIYKFHNTNGTTTEVRGNSTDSGNPLGPLQAPIIPFAWNTNTAPGGVLPYTVTQMDDPSTLPTVLTAAGAGAITWNDGNKLNWLKTAYAAAPVGDVAPTITVQPKTQSAVEGATITLSVAASGSPVLTYQWFKDGGQLSGKTASTLTLENITALDAGVYYAIVSNGILPNATSANASISLAPPPVAPAPAAASNISTTSFTANWAASANATGYRLDVSPDATFATYWPGYENLDVGNVTSKAITGLNASTTYYYRVRATVGSYATASSSNTTATTESSTFAYLVNDAMNDTDRTGGPTATNTKWVTNGSGAFSASSTGLKWTLSGSSNGMCLGYFPDVPVGTNSATLTLNFTTGNVGTTPDNFRIALIDDTATGRVTADGFSSTNAAYVGDVGYAFFASSNVGGGSMANVTFGTYKRVTTTSNNLLGTSGDWGTTLGSSPAAATGYFEANTAYTLTVKLSNTSGTLSIGTKIEGGNFSGLDYTVTDSASPVLNFNALSLRLNKSGVQFTNLNLTSLQITQGGGAPIPSVPAIYSAATASGAQGQAFTYTPAATNSPTGYALASGALPSGLALNLTTGVISGSPGENGTFNVTLIASNGNGPGAAFPLTLTISAPPPPAPAAAAATSPTANGFTANWAASAGATGYIIDVSTSATFANFVSGYENLDVGNVLSLVFNDLDPATTYYYRVRARTGELVGDNSATITVAPPAAKPAVFVKFTTARVTEATSPAIAETLTIGAPGSNWAYSAAAPYPGTTWNVIKRPLSPGIPSGTNVAGYVAGLAAYAPAQNTKLTTPAGAVTDVALSAWIDIQDPENGRSEPSNYDNGVATPNLGPDELMKNALRIYRPLNTGKFTFSNLPADTHYLVYFYSAIRTAGSGCKYILAAGNVPVASPSWIEIPGTANSEVFQTDGTNITPIPAAKTATASNAAGVVMSSWGRLTAVTTATGELTFTTARNTPNKTQAISGFQLVPYPAPVIALQPPATATATLNNSITLTVTATGLDASDVLVYQWRKNGVNVDATANPSAATAAFTIASAQVSDIDSYDVVVSNLGGEVTSTAVALDVTTSAIAPSVTTPPAAKTADINGTATFTVSANGTSPLSYVWQYSATSATDDLTFADISASSATPSLTLTNIASANAGYYRVKITNSVSTVTSAAATLTVKPVITTQPVAAVVAAGSHTISVAANTGATGAPFAPTYVWKRNDVVVTDGAGISGATTAALSFTSFAAANSGVYTVTVTNNAGSVTSTPVFVGVPTAQTVTLFPANNATNVNPDTPPTLTFTAAPSVGIVGTVRIYDAADDSLVDTIDLSSLSTVAATVPAGTTYRYTTRTIGAKSYNAFPIVTVGNTARLTLSSSTKLAYNKTYYVQITPGTVLDSTGATYPGINDKTSWRFTTKAAAPSATAAAYTVAADGTGDFTTLQGALDIIPTTNTTPRTLTLKNGTYHEIVHIQTGQNLITIQGESRSGTVIEYLNNNTLLNGAHMYGRTVFLMEANDFTIQNLTLRNLTPKAGSQAEVLTISSSTQRSIVNRCNVLSLQDTIYAGKQSFFIDSYIEGDVDFMWSDGSAYFLRNELKAMNNSSYYTQIRNQPTSLGYVYVDSEFTRDAAVADASCFLSRIDVGASGYSNVWPASMMLLVDCFMDAHIAPQPWRISSGSNLAEIRFWEYNTKKLDGTPADISQRPTYNNIATGAPGAALVLPNQQVDLVTANYYRNPANVVGFTPAIAPVIDTQPVAQTVASGSTATLNIDYTAGYPTATIQWFKGATAIGTGTSATLTIPNAQSTDAGNYHAVITNPSATLTSGTVALTVNTVVAPTPPTVAAASTITANGFTANWAAVTGATGYRLDVSTSAAFAAGSFVSGYEDLDVGTNLNRAITGLTAGTSYYYRVRAVGPGGTSTSSTASPAVNTPTAPVGTGYLVNDTFSNNDRIGGFDGSVTSPTSPLVLAPTGTNTQWVATSTNTLVATGSNMTWSYTGTSSVMTMGYFPDVTVAASGTTTIKLNFTTGNIGTVADNLRIALTNDTAGGRVDNDSFSSTEARQIGDNGYAIFSAASTVGNSTTNLGLKTYERSVLTSGDLLSGSANWTALTPASAGSTGYLEANTTYTLILTLTNNSAGTALSLRTQLTGGNFSGLDYTITDSTSPVFTFNTLAFRMGKGTAQFSNIKFNSLKIYEGEEPAAVAPPAAPATSAPSSIAANGFTANWAAVSGATGYRLDVSTSAAFAAGSFVSGYEDLDVGTNLNRAITGLTPGATYYYRVRAVGPGGTSASSTSSTPVTTTAAPVATDIVNDLMQDADRIGGNPGNPTTRTTPGVSLPTATNTQWVTTGYGAPSDLIASSAGIKWSPVGTSSVMTLGYMPDFTVGTNETVTLNLNVTIGAAGTVANNLRIALINDGGDSNRVKLDGFSASNAGYAGDTGYAMFTASSNVGGGSTTDLSLNTYKRTALAVTGSNLLGAAGDWGNLADVGTQAIGKSEGATGNFAASGTYNLTLTVANDGNKIALTTHIDGGNFDDMDYTIIDNTASRVTTFTALALRLGNAGQFGSINLNNLKVTKVTGATIPAPTIATQPLGDTITVGGTATMNVVATGPQPRTYQWFKSGTVISTGTTANLTVPDATLGDAGNYTVAVVNASGTTTSSVALLTVNPAPVTAAPVITSSTTGAATVGTAYAYTIVATNSPISYGASPLPGGLTLASGTLSGTPTTSGTYNIGLTATNLIGTGSATLVLTVTDPLPTAPVITNTNLSAPGTVGSVFSYQIAASNTPTSYAVAGTLPSGVTYDTGSGLISGTPTAAGTSTVTLTATNAGGTSASVTLTITIAPYVPPATTPVINGNVTVAATQNTVFSYAISASGNPTSYAATGLPPGLTINTATGVISGTPTSTGNYTVVLSATNPGGTGTSNLTINIGPQAPITAAPVIDTPATINAPVDTPFDQTITATNSPTSFGATGLPSGLAINTATGAITGLPAIIGTYNVTLTAENGVGKGTKQVVLTIEGKAGIITLAGTPGVFGSDNGASTAAKFNAPVGAAVDNAGNIYIADTTNHAIRRIATDGTVSTFAGQPATHALTNGIGAAARFNAPTAIVIDAAGTTLYVADTANNAIRKIVISTGEVSTIAGTFSAPSGLALDPTGNLYVANAGNNTISKIALSSGVVSLYAGSSTAPAGATDGTLTTARFDAPTGLAMDASDAHLYIADTGNSTIRVITISSSTVETLAGAADQPGDADGILTAARFDSPEALAVDAAGNIYVADTGNDTLRRIDAVTHAVTTIIGLAGQHGTQEGTGSQARLNAPAGITVDATGDIYVLDTNNHLVRALLTSPSITTNPASQTVAAGASVALKVLAAGSPAPTYQWYKNGTLLATGTAATLELKPVTTTDAGGYTVMMMNPMGTAQSTTATLTVNGNSGTQPPGPVSTSSGGGAPGWWYMLGLASLLAIRGLRRNRD